jgi:hypothetical protein
MADILPTVFFPGFQVLEAADAVTADSIVIPLAALPNLTAEEANPLTGDGREVARQIDLVINEKFTALATEDKPAAMTSGVGVTTLQNGNRRITVSRTYELTAPLAQLSIIAEPEPETP